MLPAAEASPEGQQRQRDVAPLLVPVANPYEKNQEFSLDGAPIERRKKQCNMSWTCCAASFLAVTFIVLVIPTTFVIIQSDMEVSRAREAASTSWLYSTEQVCGTVYSKIDGALSVETFNSSAEANESGAHVAHCGACGQCSTQRDIEIYNETRQTLTKLATACAMKTSKSGTERCMDETIGFTPGCRGCWVQNIECTQTNCFYTCLRSVALGESTTATGADGSSELNSCLMCDEKMCGPQFTLCAGVNRRRAGISTDIARDQSFELCKSIDAHPWQGAEEDSQLASGVDSPDEDESAAVVAAGEEEEDSVGDGSPGSRCVEHTDCLSGDCCLLLGVCGGREDGDVCISSCDCASPDGCVDGRCGYRRVGHACTRDDVCASKACFAAPTSAQAMPQGELPAAQEGEGEQSGGGFCIEPRGVGGTCLTDSHCNKGDCCSGVCAERAEDGKVCSQDCECRSAEGCLLGSCGRKGDGEFCFSDEHCVSTDGCILGSCARKEDGGDCSEDAHCVSADGCVMETCGRQQDGQQCNDDGQCESGACYQGLCIEPKGNALPCNASKQCSSANCCAGRCEYSDNQDGTACQDDCSCESEDGCVRGTCGKQEEGQRCESRGECKSNTCHKGECVRGSDNGNVCFASSECVSNICYLGVCIDPAPDSTPCSDPSQCASANCCAGFCTTASPDGTVCAASCACTSLFGCIMGSCGKSDIGGLCAKDADCKQGVCYIGVCTSGMPDGSPCTGGNVCASGVCCGALCTTPQKKGVTCAYSCACLSNSCNWNFQCD
mmetsp:Transcript_50041/g.102043  ORF Transcript_50041/g.102043 Transcript_50041/m.102043 type:complete len:782 (-) Transcript_50041:153-2498(-)